MSVTGGLTYRGMNVDRLFFPTKGRLERKVRRHADDGWFFRGSTYAFWWGPFCVFLVFEKIECVVQ